MLTYYLDLALRSFRSARGLTALMVIAIGLGLGASMTTLATLRALAADPIPGRSATLMRVQLDPWPRGSRAEGTEPDDLLTLLDAETLLHERHAQRQAMMTGGDVTLEPPAANGQAHPIESTARYTSADFFPMFATPFAHGAPWGAAEDAAAAPVVVLSDELNVQVFGGADSVGRMLRVDDVDYRVVGVLAPWQPVPYFFDLNVGRFRRTEGLFVPFSTALQHKLDTSGSLHCWGNDAVPHPLDSGAPCSWVQYWVELAAPADRAGFLAYLQSYSARQHEAGRYERAPNARLRDVMAFLSFKQIVPEDVRLQVWLAFGFLAVCLLNTVGLLLAKCLRRSAEIGVRRALGAPRRQIFVQFLVEAGTVGLAGGVLGLGLAAAGVWIVRAGASSRAQWVHLDAATLALTFALAIAASLAAGLLPAWRACQVSPATQLKSA